MFSKLLSALGFAPKTLDQAHTTFTEAKATLDSVSALFTAAGLNLEQMLAAGPDALKAHLASIDNSAEVTRLTAELGTATAHLATARESITEHEAERAAVNECFTAIGLADFASKTPATDIKAKFESHVAKQTTLALAKTGHPPAHVPAAVETTTAAKTDAELAAEYRAMPAGEARQTFYAQHEKALWRAAQAASNRPE